ncbi:MAG TPA: hypothetical protein VFP09_08045 [Desertimonas sp.]|nr:hypothetical protein [Desertimonas sp.]
MTTSSSVPAGLRLGDGDARRYVAVLALACAIPHRPPTQIEAP